ncbi:tubulin gamma [Pancytospora philotis]|nr:tubulin gamma [Pancytospora philotis]
MHEVITLQVGQCGNQVGNEFWRKIAGDHNIADDGVVGSELDDRKDRFFYQTDCGRFIPRAVLMDLEPRVIGQCLPFFSMENMFIANEGGGAGNNWAHGYYVANKVRAEVSDVIQREAEACDALSGFSLIHSVAGGTGSGFGSLLVEELRDVFPKATISAQSILPTNEEGSDVVVQPYNTVLTLAHLYDACDSITMMDNHALGRIAMESTRARSPNLNIINALIATALGASNATIRFPSYAFCDAHSILSCIVPVPSLKLVIPSYAPFIADTLHGIVRKKTVADIMHRLLIPKTRLCTYESSHTQANISVFNILEGVEAPAEVSRAAAMLHNRALTAFVPWMPPFYQTALSRRASEHSRVSGLALSNSTGSAAILRKICFQFDQLRKRSAFIDIYRKFDAELTTFDSSREKIQGVVDMYDQAETAPVKY